MVTQLPQQGWLWKEIGIRLAGAMDNCQGYWKFMRKTGRPIDLKPKNRITFDKSKMNALTVIKFKLKSLVEQDVGAWSLMQKYIVHFGQMGLGDFDESTKMMIPVSLALRLQSSEGSRGHKDSGEPTFNRVNHSNFSGNSGTLTKEVFLSLLPVYLQGKDQEFQSSYFNNSPGRPYHPKDGMEVLLDPRESTSLDIYNTQTNLSIPEEDLKGFLILLTGMLWNVSTGGQGQAVDVKVFKEAPRKNDVYSLDLKNIIPSGGVTCLVAKATKDEAVLWHRRLGHVNFKNINKLVKGNLVRGLPSKTFKLDHSCLACRKGKQHRASCKKIEERTVREPLELLHMDLFGPVSVESVNRKKYCLVVTDDCRLENKLRHKVKTISYGKGIPQQNVSQRERIGNSLKLLRTLLADSLLLFILGMKQSILLVIQKKAICWDNLLTAKVFRVYIRSHRKVQDCLNCPVRKDKLADSGGQENACKMLMISQDQLFIVLCSTDELVSLMHQEISCLKFIMMLNETPVKMKRGELHLEREKFCVEILDDVIPKDGVFSTYSFDVEKYRHWGAKQELTTKISRTCLFACFFSHGGTQEKVSQALEDESWFEAIARRRAFASIQATIFMGASGFEGILSIHNKVSMVIGEGLLTKLAVIKKGEKSYLVWFWFQVTPKVSHIHAVKGFLDSEYAGDNHDRRSTSGMSISWKKNGLLAMLLETNQLWHISLQRQNICTPAACCCAQRSFGCKISTTVVINVVKVHTDDNVADLLTKGFDLARFNFLVVSIGMIEPLLPLMGRITCKVLVFIKFFGTRSENISPKRKLHWDTFWGTNIAYDLVGLAQIKCSFLLDDYEWDARTYFQWKHSPKFSCRITPLTPPMLEVVTALAAEAEHSTSPHSRAASSARDAQGTPTQSAAQASISTAQDTAGTQGTAQAQDTDEVQDTDPAQGATAIPKSPNDYTPTDASQTSGGDEGLLDLYALNKEVKRLKRQTLSQAKQILKLKTKLEKLSKFVQPVVKHHAFWVESQNLKKRRKKQRKEHKKKVSSVKLGRNKEEGFFCLSALWFKIDYTADPFFEDIVDKDAAVTPDLERKSDETEEINIEEKKASDVKSGDTKELDLEAVQSTARQSTITPRTLNFNDEAGPSSPIRPTQFIELKNKKISSFKRVDDKDAGFGMEFEDESEISIAVIICSFCRTTKLVMILKKLLTSPEQTATGVTFQDTQTDCVQDTAQRMKLKRLKASTALMTRQTDAEQRRPTIKKLEVKLVEFKLGEDCWEIQVKRSTYC
ncbi:putative ribonuclease H-like domain-containing protein [Tanacetum coccineum]